jgi:hypothetical protein
MRLKELTEEKAQRKESEYFCFGSFANISSSTYFHGFSTPLDNLIDYYVEVNRILFLMMRLRKRDTISGKRNKIVDKSGICIRLQLS